MKWILGILGYIVLVLFWLLLFKGTKHDDEGKE